MRGVTPIPEKRFTTVTAASAGTTKSMAGRTRSRWNRTMHDHSLDAAAPPCLKRMLPRSPPAVGTACWCSWSRAQWWCLAKQPGRSEKHQGRAWYELAASQTSLGRASCVGSQPAMSWMPSQPRPPWECHWRGQQHSLEYSSIFLKAHARPHERAPQ